MGMFDFFSNMSRITVGGQNVQINGNQITIDGKTYTKDEKTSIHVVGGVGSIEVKGYADIKIEGSVKGNVSTTAGDIKCGDVVGDVSTMNGDVDCKTCQKASTMNGDVNMG